ncbi:hypothetical protein [Actinacidiphila glaucinigra]|uniref:hypothetical protein n=1 Tax=Actinacidiphila glaucinigra TaxID=235986 RepID=UPI0038144593
MAFSLVSKLATAYAEIPKSIRLGCRQAAFLVAFTVLPTPACRPAQAQMALAKDVLRVASELNRALGVGYSVVEQLPSRADRDGACERAKAWFSGPLSDGVHLLKVTFAT